MVRHIVAWNFANDLPEAQNTQEAEKIKREVEALKDMIPGVLSLSVHYDLLGTSNRQLMLDSRFESADALAAYQIHPEHQRVSAYIGSLMKDRVCLDYAE